MNQVLKVALTQQKVQKVGHWSVLWLLVCPQLATRVCCATQNHWGELFSLLFCAMSSRQLVLVAVAGKSANAERIKVRASNSLSFCFGVKLCCTAQLYTFKNRYIQFNLRRQKLSLSVATEQYLRQITVNFCALSVRRTRPQPAGCVRPWYCLQYWKKQNCSWLYAFFGPLRLAFAPFSWWNAQVLCVL